MKKLLFLSVMILFIFSECKKHITEPTTTGKKIVTLSFSSDSILYKGNYYQKKITVDTNALVSVIKNGHVYFYYSGFGNKFQNSLTDTLSAKSILFRVAAILRDTNRITSKLSITQKIEAAGVLISNDGSSKYLFENLKRRIVGLKFNSSSGSQNVIMPAKGPLLDHNLITLLAEPNSADFFFDKSIYERTISTTTYNCELFGSIVSAAFASPLSIPTYLKAKTAFNADPTYFAKVNIIDAVLIAIDIIEEIIAAEPGDILCADLVGYVALEPIRVAFIATVDQSTDPLLLKDAAFNMAYETLKRSATCAAGGASAGIGNVLRWLAEVVGLIPFLADQGIRSWDVLTTDPYSKVILPFIDIPGAVAYYPFNGNANDESGNNRNGTKVGNPIFVADRFGRPTAACSLSGATQYISLPTSINVTCDITVSFWMKTNLSDNGSWPSGTFIIDRDLCGAQRDWSVGLGVGGKIQFNTGKTGTDYVLTSTSIINDDSWKHIVVMRDTANSVKKIYINGQLNSLASFDKQLFSNNSINVYIGASVCATSTHHYYKGFIDDVRIYNRALTETEIQSLYHEGGW
jgi:hypothetical protein